MVRRVFGALGVVVVSLSMGCATIVSPSRFPVGISSTPPAAKIKVTNKDGRIISDSSTPISLTLDSGNGYFSRAEYHVRFEKDGYLPHEEVIRSSFNGWYVGNILFGGLIGFLIVDPISGAMWEIDDLNLNPALAKQEPVAQTAVPAPVVQQPAVTAPAQKPVASDEKTAQVLEKLKALKAAKDQGLLTEEEYSAKRSKLLSDI